MNAASQAKLQNRYRSELKWIRRGAKARTTKQKARIQRFEELDKSIDRSSDDADLELTLATTRLGRKVLKAEKFRKHLVIGLFLKILASCCSKVTELALSEQTVTVSQHC